MNSCFMMLDNFPSSYLKLLYTTDLVLLVCKQFFDESKLMAFFKTIFWLFSPYGPWYMDKTCFYIKWNNPACSGEALQSHLTDILNLCSQMALKLRQEMQEKLVAEVASSESEQLKRFEEFMELKQRQEYQTMRDMMDRE